MEKESYWSVISVYKPNHQSIGQSIHQSINHCIRTIIQLRGLKLPRLKMKRALIVQFEVAPQHDFLAPSLK